MEARAKLFGHSIHQMLVGLPLGMLTGVIVFDIIHLISGGTRWVPISYWLITVGVISALLAAVFGFLDWTKIPAGTRAKRIASTHGVGNVIVVGLFIISWLIRGSSMAAPSAWALIFSFVAFALLLFTGWLGGELIDQLGIGINDGAHLNAPSSLSGRTTTEGLRPEGRP